jgi:predicted metal-dependent hydrolase
MNEKIPYTIKKSKIKNLYIHIKEGQVIVKAPVRLQEKYIKEFINKKTKWIYENVKRYEQKPKVEEKLDIKDIERLKEIIQKSIQKYSKTLEVIPNKIRIKNIKYAWGSCSSKKNITINLKLAKKDEKVIEYVVLHEMCHLKEMNHSNIFWELVEKNMPNYKIYKNKLKEY